MCGRFSITPSKEKIEERFHATMNAEWKPNYNVAPSQMVPIITNENPKEIVMARFGFIPSWAEDAKMGYKMINTRAETILDKPTFKTAVKTKRCLILADGFYEWKATDKHKQPYRIGIKKGELFAFAGIWNTWKGITTFSIITCSANAAMKPIHERMPVILPQDKEQEWLTNAHDEALTLLQPCDAKRMKTFVVSDAVNSVAHNSKELLLPVNSFSTSDATTFSHK